MREQEERVLNYMRAHGSITQKDAYENLGITRLAAVIFDLKNDAEVMENGIIIWKETETNKNRYGEPTHYARYFVNEKEKERW